MDEEIPGTLDIIRDIENDLIRVFSSRSYKNRYHQKKTRTYARNSVLCLKYMQYNEFNTALAKCAFRC